MIKKLTANSQKLKAPRILVSGSLVFDTIFELNSAISDQVAIENGKASKQNLMFTAEEKEIYFGGTAGNIAYGLGLLKNPSFIFSAVGKDFDGYEIHLRNSKSVFRGVKDQKGYTATYFGMTDTKKEQLGIFQSGAYGKNINSLSLSNNFSRQELESLECAIFAVGTAKSMTKQITEFRKINKEAFTIFDPGQMLAIDFTRDLLEKSLKNSDILVMNDTEFSYIKNHFEFELKNIFELGVRYIIETKGADGSSLYELENETIQETKIKSPKVKKVLDPTGAGDAYRAGIIHGIVNNLDIKESMVLASKLGSECVKHRGGQTYKVK
jgi:adenosine kinase